MTGEPGGPGGTVLLTYASRPYRALQREAIASGMANGGFAGARAWGPRQLGWRFRWENRAILRQRRGAGFWLWKPAIILRALEDLGPGETLFYADCDVQFVGPVAPYVRVLDGEARGLVLFRNEPEHANDRWTKRDCFVLLGLDAPAYHAGRQLSAGYVLCRRTPFVLAFLREWLSACQDARILTDRLNTCRLPDLPGFIEHRHDQSVLSLLAQRVGVLCLADPSQWGNPYREPGLPQLVVNTHAGPGATRGLRSPADP